MKNIAIIPARGGSKRLPKKNLMLLGGIPLIVHSILYAKANQNHIDEVYVSTDDAAIKACALEYGAMVIDRPGEISGDHEPTVTALMHVVENCKMDISNVILLQPTNPLRPENLLSECFQKYLDMKADSLFTVSRNKHKLGKVRNGKFVPHNYIPGQRSQDLEPLFFENGLLYISSAELIRDQHIISENAIPFETEGAYSNVDIDTLEDFEYAAWLFGKFKTKSL